VREPFRLGTNPALNSQAGGLGWKRQPFRLKTRVPLCQFFPNNGRSNRLPKGSTP
jgi:hypothetical protein